MSEKYIENHFDEIIGYESEIEARMIDADCTIDGLIEDNKKTDFRSYFITFEDGARLEIMNKPDMVDAEKYLNRTGLIHIAFSVGSKERVDEITQLLQTDGYHIVSGPRTTGDGYYESCVAAIENNQIEFSV
jgi:lactoylglutathione lyase